MPLFPGERPMSAIERRDPDFVANALPGLEEQTGLPPGNVHLSVFHMAANGWDYVIARPLIILRSGTTRDPNPDRWWVYDADVDESECWVPQATFTPAGNIDHPEDRRFADFDHAMLGPDPTPPNDDDDDGMFPAWDPAVRVTSGEEPSAPRDPNAPVRATIDLDEHEAAEREGIPAWEEHGDFSVLVNENGFAIVTPPGTGLVRYPDKTACTFNANGTNEARVQAEKFLAKRPYKTAMERVLEEPEFDAPDPVAEPNPHDPPTSPAVPRAKPEKRVWNTTPIASAEDDD